MFKLGVSFATILVFNCQIIWQSNAMPHDNKVLYQLNKTTTAIPMYNATKIVAVPQNPMSTAGSLMTTTTNGWYGTKTMVDTKSNVPPEATSTIVSSTVPTVSYDRQATRDHFFVTTTAVLPSMGSALPEQHFDSLSFMGGTLLGIGVIAVGTLTWKMYIARIERSYWTL